MLVRAGGGAVSPGSGREGGGRGAGRQRRATDPSPGGSGRYRPAVARVGGGSAARGRRERGEREATRWRLQARGRREAGVRGWRVGPPRRKVKKELKGEGKKGRKKAGVEVTWL